MNQLSKIFPLLVMSSLLLKASIGFADDNERGTTAPDLDATMVLVAEAQVLAADSLQQAQALAADSFQQAQDAMSMVESSLDSAAYGVIVRSLGSFVELGVLDLTSEEELPDLAEIAQNPDYRAWAEAQSIEDPLGYLQAIARLEMLYFVYSGMLTDDSDGIGEANLEQLIEGENMELEATVASLQESLVGSDELIESLEGLTVDQLVATEIQLEAMQAIEEIEQSAIEVETLTASLIEANSLMEASAEVFELEMESLSNNLLGLFSAEEIKLIEENHEGYSQVRDAAGLNSF